MRYRKISIQIWNDAKFRLLSDDAKLLFFFLLTHPHMTSIGAMRGTPQGLAAELGWLPQRLSKGFQEGCSKGMVKYDERASCIWLPNFVKHNKPESPNVIKSWSSAFELIPECDFRSLIYKELRYVTDGMGEAFIKAFGSLSEDFGKAMPNQEQEQEQDNQIPPISPPQPEGDLFPDDGVSQTVSSEPPKKKAAEVYAEHGKEFYDYWPSGHLHKKNEPGVIKWFVNNRIKRDKLNEILDGLDAKMSILDREAQQKGERAAPSYKFLSSPMKFLKESQWVEALKIDDAQSPPENTFGGYTEEEIDRINAEAYAKPRYNPFNPELGFPPGIDPKDFAPAHDQNA